MRTNRALLAVLALGALFLVALTQLVNVAFSRAPIYQDYSSMRADPLGAKALYETLAAVPGVRVERNLRRPARLADVQATVFWLGESAFAPRVWKKQELEAFEAMTRRGGRLVIGLLPAGPSYVDPEEKKTKKPADLLDVQVVSEMEKRWRLGVQREVAKKESESDNGVRRETSLWLKPLTAEWTCLAENKGRCLTAERTFGAGTIVMSADTFPLSNEGLRGARRPQWIAQLVGPWKRVIFDEAHLGVQESGSIGTLIRQFRLEAAALMLVTLAALFIWRNGSSFLPQRAPAPDTALTGDPHRSLTLLLRRGIAPAALAQNCLDEWQRAKALLPYRQSRRMEAAAAAAAGATTPLQAWQRVRQAIEEKS
jgi:hypothetical protein